MIRKLFASFAVTLPALALAAMTQGIPDQAKKDFADGVNASGSTYVLRLYASTGTGGLSSTTCSGLTGELSTGGGYTAGGQTLTRGTTTVASNVASINFTSPVTWASSTITARYAAICNTTSGNVVAIFNLDGASGTIDKISTGGDFVVTIPSGVLKIQ